MTHIRKSVTRVTGRRVVVKAAPRVEAKTDTPPRPTLEEETKELQRYYGLDKLIAPPYKR